MKTLISKFSEEISKKREQSKASLFFRMAIRNKIKQGFDGKEYVLKDGTRLYVTEFKPGGVAVTASNDIPLPIGKYELNNGDFLFIGAGGLIGQITNKDGKKLN